MKNKILITVAMLFASNCFAQIGITLDTLDIGSLIFVRNEIAHDSIVGTIVAEYEKPEVRIVLNINGLDNINNISIYHFYGCFTYQNRNIKSRLFLNYCDKQKSQITLTNPSFFDGILYQFPENGIEDYTRDILEIVSDFKVRMEIRDDILIAESDCPATIILTR